MRTITTYLPAIACGAMVLFICVPMLLGRKHDQTSNHSEMKREIADLRAEIARLETKRASTDESETIDG